MLSSPKARRQAAALLAPALAAAALLVVARWSAPVSAGLILLGLGMTLIGGLAAIHRPFGGRTLGLGAAVVVPLAAGLGAGTAAWAAGLALAVAHLGQSLLFRRFDLLRPGGAGLGALAAAGRSCLAALGVGWLWAALPPGWSLAATAAATFALYLLVCLALDALTRELGSLASRHQPVWRRALPRRRELPPYAVDLVGWAAGTLVWWLGRDAGWVGVTAPLVLLAAVGLEAARQAALAAAAERRLADFSRVQRAGERMIAPVRELVAVVGRIHSECVNVCSCLWFQLELSEPGSPGADSGSGSGSGRRPPRTVWSAGPDWLVVEGEARPGPYPPPLPGVHRRSEWQVIERPLEHAPADPEDRGELRARLTLWCDPRRLTDEDRALLDALLPQMSASLYQALLDREARRDALTGAAVRRVLDRRLHAVWSEAGRQGGSLALVLCDIDHFKSVNDTWGHPVGDRALVEVAQALAAAKRDEDLLARYGGEEFVLLVEGADGAAALAVAERLRERVEGIELEVMGKKIPLTVSLGVSAFPELTVKTAGELMLLADEALYEAKQRGRNRCLLHLGRGRFRAPDGSLFGRLDTSEPQVPRLFA